jgi:hypothetical protein
MTAAQRILELRSQIAHHNERYYAHDAPEISDADYDLLVRQLAQMEAEHPELAVADSPTQQVGAGALSTSFSEVVHRVPMTSLDRDGHRGAHRLGRAGCQRPGAAARFARRDRRAGDEPAPRTALRPAATATGGWARRDANVATIAGAEGSVAPAV